MCGLFLFTLVCGRHERKRGLEISNFLGFLGIVRADGARADLSGSENFWDFWKFWGKNEIF